MTVETKRDVFDELLKMYRNSMKLTHEEPVILDNDGYDIFGKIEKSYADALPDDMPVIPKIIGNFIKQSVYEDATLQEALECAHDKQFRVGRWISAHSEFFARAWLLGVWRVEETGEIVKLEEEK